VSPKIAGMESTAKMTSALPMAISATASGVM
jgi:hypothetical protein